VDIRVFSYSYINWSSWLGPEYIRKFDRNKVDKDNPLSLIYALGDFRIDKNNIPDYLLKHLFLTVCVKDIVIDALSISTLSYSGIGDDAGLLSGTLFDWKYSIVSGTDDKVSKTTRTMFNMIYIELGRTDLKRIWKSCAKRRLADGTFQIKVK